MNWPHNICVGVCKSRVKKGNTILFTCRWWWPGRKEALKRRDQASCSSRVLMNSTDASLVQGVFYIPSKYSSKPASASVALLLIICPSPCFSSPISVLMLKYNMLRYRNVCPIINLVSYVPIWSTIQPFLYASIHKITDLPVGVLLFSSGYSVILPRENADGCDQSSRL